MELSWDLVLLYESVLETRGRLDKFGQALGKIIDGELKKYDKDSISVSEIKQGDKVEIAWLDACIEEAIVPQVAIKELKPLLRHNLGYVQSIDDEQVCLSFGDVQNFYKGLTACDIPMSIPRSVITSIKKQGDIE